MSAKLSTLEAQIGVTLFGRKGRNSFPLRSAVWLYNRSVRLLLAEEYLSHAKLGGSAAPSAPVILKLDVDYTWTAISYAVITAIRRFHSKPDHPYVDLIFTGTGAFGMQNGPSHLLSDAVPLGQLKIQHTIGTGVSGPSVVVAPDHWTRLTHTVGERPERGDIAPKTEIPDLPGTLQSDTKFDRSSGIATSRISTTDRSLQDLRGLIDDIRKSDLLLPQLTVPQRLRIQGITAVPVIRSPSCCVTAELSNDHELLLNLLNDVRKGVEAPSGWSEATNFHPKVSLKQISTVNRVVQTGSMASAARVAGRTAPMIPAQLEQIEYALGTRLIDRKKTGSEPTDDAERLHSLFVGVERAFNDTLGERSHIAAAFEQSIRIALPVSWSADSLTSECMAVALSAFHNEFPNCQIEVVEGPRHVLHHGVLTGRFNIAVVGRIDPQVGSLLIGRSEDVVLIVNRKLNFAPQAERVSADELRSIPLLLAPSQLTMHQTLLTALAKSTVQLEPVMRLGSVPLIVSVLRRSPLGTILPASVMIKEIEAGIVDTFSLDHLVPPRRLWAIFSTSTPLNETERALISHVKEAFQEANSSNGRVVP
uniref:LysR family transcriptional regulator n=1 Tax=Rhizobium rhizogenes TaxID=359 RepID=UPI00155DC3B2|nr:LysR family transcriptional regulator [Rhizobium rhizogenes]